MYRFVRGGVNSRTANSGTAYSGTLLGGLFTIAVAFFLFDAAFLFDSATAAQPAGDGALKKPTSYRKLAEGVETTIPIHRDLDETFSVHNIVEFVPTIADLQWTTQYAPQSETLHSMAQNVTFRRTVWNLELTFKPLRMMWVDIPQPSGKMQRKLIWYMVYRVKNYGRHLAPVKQQDGTYAVQPNDSVPVRFFPHFVLESHEYQKAYLDRIIPNAIVAIRRREDPNRPLLNSVEMGQVKLKVSTDKHHPEAKEKIDHSVWGVATWEDVDPKVDFFSVYVRGLTNAYQWTDNPKVVKPGDPPGTGRTFKRRTLKLNFWRPGDQYLQNEREIRYGIPGKVDYEWVWR